MSAAISLALAILPQIPGLVGDVEAIWSSIFGIRAAAQQSNDWTADAEAAFQAALVVDGKSPDWQPAT
nr:hypothetical protein [uncultured Rhodopila sp.]